MKTIKLSTILISIFLSWVALDLNLGRQRRQSYSITTLEISDELRTVKKFRRLSSNVIPAWLRNYRKPEKLKCNYFSTKPRDVRYSDQRKIRRRINNM